MAESDEAVIVLLLEMRADLRAMREIIATSADVYSLPATLGSLRADLRATVANIRGTIAASGQRLCAELESLRLLVEQNRAELEASVCPGASRSRAGFQ